MGEMLVPFSGVNNHNRGDSGFPFHLPKSRSTSMDTLLYKVCLSVIVALLCAWLVVCEVGLSRVYLP